MVDLTEDDDDTPKETADCQSSRPSRSPPRGTPLIERPPPSPQPRTTGETTPDQVASAVGGDRAKETAPPPGAEPMPLSPSLDNEVDAQPRSTYLRHFEDALRTVMHSRQDLACLFTSEERELVQRFDSLGRGSKCLYIRLFQRKGPWFRVDGMMGYDEVGTGMPLWVRRRAATAGTNNSAWDTKPVEVVDGPKGSLPSTPFASVGSGARTKTATASRTPAEAEEIPGTVPQEERADATNPYNGASEESPTPVSVELSPGELTSLHSEIQTALHELIEGGFLQVLPDDMSGADPKLDAVLGAVDCCLRSDEIRSLLKKTGGGKMIPGRLRRGGSADCPPPACGRSGMKARQGHGADSKPADRGGAVGAQGGRRGMMRELHQRLTGQHTLWGTRLPLVKEIESLVSRSVESMGVRASTTKRPGRAGRAVSGGGDASDRPGQSRMYWVVLIADNPRLVFRRALRLLYLTCNTSALSSGVVGAASVRGAGVAGAMSSWTPGLSVAFGKARCVHRDPDAEPPDWSKHPRPRDWFVTVRV